MKIVKRILGFIPVLTLILIGLFSTLIDIMWNYIKHGGEYFSYTRSANLTTFSDLYNGFSTENQYKALLQDYVQILIENAKLKEQLKNDNSSSI